MTLHWSEEFAVNVEYFDDQHRKLFRMVALLSSAVTQHDNEEIIRGLLLDLALFAKKHFEDEESLMERMGYPLLAEHRVEHRDYRERLGALLMEAVNGVQVGMAVLKLTQEWLHEHLLTTDRKYSEFFRTNGVQ